jgi:hypothetical protein
MGYRILEGELPFVFTKKKYHIWEKRQPAVAADLSVEAL